MKSAWHVDNHMCYHKTVGDFQAFKKITENIENWEWRNVHNSDDLVQWISSAVKKQDQNSVEKKF